jgi:site-specific DNA recombinase
MSSNALSHPKDENSAALAVGYIRVSTEGQAENGLGLSIQESQIQQFCDKSPQLSLAKIYKDAGLSGASIDNRPALLQLLEDARQGLFKKVIVAKLDRIARDTFYTLWIEKELKKYSVELYSIAEPYRWDDPVQKIFLQIISSFAEYEKNRIVERLYAGRRKKLESGKYAGGRPAYGYKAKDGKLTLNRHEAETIREIRALRMGRMSYQRIAEKLNAKGVKPSRADKFYASTIHYMLKNKTYKGVIRYGSSATGVHPSI